VDDIALTACVSHDWSRIQTTMGDTKEAFACVATVQFSTCSGRERNHGSFVIQMHKLWRSCVIDVVLHLSMLLYNHRQAAPQ